MCPTFFTCVRFFEKLYKFMKKLITHQYIGVLPWKVKSKRNFNDCSPSWNINLLFFNKFMKVKGTIMQIEKALINDGLCVSKVTGKFHIPTIYNFAVIYL